MTDRTTEGELPEQDQPTAVPMPRVFEWTDADLVAALEVAAVAPRSGSPLAETAASGGGPRTPPSSSTRGALPADAREALHRVARPDTIVTLGISVPTVRESHVAWYYACEGDERLALYSIAPDGRHRVLYPVLAQSILEVAHGALQLERAVDLVGVSVALDENGLVALALVTDWMTERTTRAFLLRREPDRDWRFDVHELLALTPWAESDDPRWMVPRAAFLAPAPLSWAPGALERGLDRLTAGGLLFFDAGGYRLSDRLGVLCGLLGTSSGACAIATRRRHADGTWDLGHWAGMTGVATLWALEFDEITETGFAVNIADVDPATAFGRMADLLHPTRVGVAEAPVPACKQCGHALAPGARFCDQCGTPIAQLTPGPRDQPASREQPATCARCGAALRPGLKFCTQCGAPANR